jgi:hypothetical protein
LLGSLALPQLWIEKLMTAELPSNRLGLRTGI